MYELVTGPLAWIAFLIFIMGMTLKTISTIRLASKKDSPFRGGKESDDVL